MSAKKFLTTTRFNFESSIINLTDKNRIQLCPDSLNNNGISFNLELDNSENFYYSLLYVSSVLLDQKSEYFEDKYNYNIWKEEATISSIARTLKEEERKPKHLREDLNVIYERKENLVNRIKSQISHFDNNQMRIKSTLKEQSINFRQYHPLILSIYPDSLILEAIQFEAKYYVRYELHRSSMLYNDLPEMGSAFLEFNFQFFNELLSKINLSKLADSNAIQIISSPWNEQNYMKRPNIASSRRRINFDYSIINLYRLSPMIELLYNDVNNQYIKHLDLSRSEVLDFVHIIENQCSQHQIIDVQFEGDTKIDNTIFRVIDKILFITVPSVFDQTLYFKLHVNAIKNLKHLSHLIENIKFSFIYEYLPVVLTLKMKNDTMSIVQQFFNSDYDTQLFRILTSYHTFKYDKKLYNKISKYVKNNQSVNDNEIQFSFKLSDEELHSAIADLMLSGTILIDTIAGKLRFRDPFKIQLADIEDIIFQEEDFIKLASAMSDLFLEYVQSSLNDDKKNYTVSGFIFKPTILLDEKNYVIEKNCNCASNSAKRPCYHIFALHIAIIKGGFT